MVSTEYANKLRHFIERATKYVNHVLNRCKLEIAIKLPEEVEILGVETIFPLRRDSLWGEGHHRQKTCLYARVEG